MLKNTQTYFKSYMLWTPQDLKSMFGRFAALYMNS